MIARGRYRQSFAPAAGARGMRETIDGERATVRVQGGSPEQRADVPLVREGGRWRLVIDIPPVRERVEPPPSPLEP